MLYDLFEREAESHGSPLLLKLELAQVRQQVPKAVLINHQFIMWARFWDHPQSRKS
jgi:hypothetical protein